MEQKIIGGADGPTGIYLKSAFSPGVVTILVIIGIAIVVTLAIIMIKKRRNKY